MIITFCLPQTFLLQGLEEQEETIKQSNRVDWSAKPLSKDNLIVRGIVLKSLPYYCRIWLFKLSRSMSVSMAEQNMII